MKTLMNILTVALTSLVLGCFAGPSDRPLSLMEANLDRQTPAVAILPISADQVRLSLEYPTTSTGKISWSATGGHKDLLRCANSVLNTLLGEEKGSLMGPERVKYLLKGSNDLQALSVCILDPEPLTAEWKLELLSEIGRKLNAKVLVIVNPVVKLVPLHINGSESSIDVNWSGRAIVSLDAVGIDPPRFIKSCSGESDFWGKSGLAGSGSHGRGLSLPYAYGKGLCRAVDQAARQAFSELANTVLSMDN